MNNFTNDEKYIMWLTRIEGLGSKKLHALMESFGSAREIFHAPRELLRTVPEISEQNAANIVAAQSNELLNRYENELVSKKIRFISRYNEDYPPLLNEIFTPPMGIYIKGSLPDSSMPAVSVIGSRRCSEYGVTVSYKISKELASRGVVIVSGMARGIDSMAHRGAVDGNGKTIAVLGSGVDICYPSENRALMEKIINGNGCVISEYPPGTHPLPGHFPMRNRIISGLSNATIVVEAALRSGTLITVEQALEQGRDVFAVPGNVTSKLSQGTNNLIRQGAALISGYEDVLKELGIDIESDNLTKNADNEPELAPEEKIVYDCIRFEPVTIDFIIQKLNSDVPTVNYMLTLLEMKGCVRRLPGQRYIRSL